jgi:hypothetical protein
LALLQPAFVIHHSESGGHQWAPVVAVHDLLGGAKEHQELRGRGTCWENNIEIVSEVEAVVEFGSGLNASVHNNFHSGTALFFRTIVWASFKAIKLLRI